MIKDVNNKEYFFMIKVFNCKVIYYIINHNKKNLIFFLKKMLYV